jgi:protein tyrosine phosphatase (PTP) superfamily phosphohydrolase (DUF442 family)
MTPSSLRQARCGAALVSFLCLALFVRAQQATALPQLVFDAEPDKQKEPFNFRTMKDAFPKVEGPAPNREGLDTLRASGSASFSEESLRKIKDRLPVKKVTVVDLRQESHGYLNGLTVEWWGDHNAANKAKSFDQIQKDETARLAALKDAGQATVFLVGKGEKRVEETGATKLALKNVQTEQELCKANQLGYFRIPVTDREKPDDAEVDRFLGLIRELPDDSWLHFHCRAGQGRTTTFLAMYDMMHNAKKVSRDDILRRQQLLGGADLASDGPKDDWRYEGYVARRLFLEKFYDYCKANDDGFKTRWSDWLAKK